MLFIQVQLMLNVKIYGQKLKKQANLSELCAVNNTRIHSTMQ